MAQKKGIDNQICWGCMKATGGCAWSDNLKPVKGWDAEEVDRKYAMTYRIKSCPEYVKDSDGISDYICGKCKHYEDHKCSISRYKIVSFYSSPCKNYEYKGD